MGWPLRVENGASRSGEAPKRSRSQRSTVESSRSSRVAMTGSLRSASPMEWQRDGYTISDDPARVDVDAVHRYLSEESYWAPGVPRDVVAKSIEWSLPFGLYAPDGSLAGFARAVTDRAVFAYVADVFVLDAHRGRGLGTWLMEALVGHP